MNLVQQQALCELLHCDGPDVGRPARRRLSCWAALGTDVGPIVVPWASLATLLWYERCRAQSVSISWRRFVLTGTVTAAAALAVSTAALLTEARILRW